MKIYNITEALSSYFNNYLKLQRNVSNNTIISYKYTFKSLIKYLINNNITTLKDFSFNDFTRENILDFLNDVESKTSISTRNQRLAAIKSFCQYLQYEPIEHLNQIQKILKIRMKKFPIKEIDFLTKEELTLYLNSINTDNKKGIRDYTLISFMYETGARINEVINVKICDLQLNDNYNVLLHGKGNKLRRVPITNELKNMLLKYINAFRLNSTSYLFQGQKYQKASTKMITHIVKKYAIKSKMNKSIHPHVFRHTRAMHLLEAGLTLVDIRDILGHESIKTTEIYLKINIELKRNAILNVYKNNDSFEESSWIKDENGLKELLDL